MKKRTKFIGLEVLLMSIVFIGYIIIDAIFLADYTPVDTLLSTNEYTLYFVCMVVLIVILAVVPFLAGMQFQTWMIKRSMIKMVDDMEISKLSSLLTNFKVDKNEPPEKTIE